MLSGLVATLRAWADQAGGLGLFVLSVLDSAAIPLPNATDALIIYLTLQQPALWWWYAGAAVAGAVVGSLPLYWIGRRGGEALFRRRFSGRGGAAALAWYRRSAFGAILIPAFLPPPLPFKIFAVLAGVTALPVWRFALALTLGRSVRHGVEGLLAAYYGNRAGAIFDEWKAAIALSLAAAVLLAGAAMLWRRRAASGR
jgi:membrane protein YqaA with SNARE-associated domain